MSTRSSRSRDHAETFFTSADTQYLSRSLKEAEHDTVSQARDAKTARLRELRLAKEALDLAAAPAVSTKRTAKR